MDTKRGKIDMNSEKDLIRIVDNFVIQKLLLIKENTLPLYRHNFGGGLASPALKSIQKSPPCRL